MRIVVTGSAGFIGFHVASALLERGDTVLGLDNLNAYYPPIIKRARHAQLAPHANFEAVTLDLADGEGVSRAVAEFRPDVVVNLAAQAGVRYSLKNPHAYVAANVTGFVNVLEACRHHDVARVVYASSSSVYGGNTALPFSIDDRVDHPISLYAATKKANELIAHTYSHLFGLQTVGLRFFTVYGPWGRPDMAMWIFAERILANEPLPVFNHGQMMRDFTYIDDIVAGVLASIDRELGHYEIFNLGNHKSEKLLDVIRLLGDALDHEPQLDLQPMQPGDVPATFADIRASTDKLGFVPTTTVATGIPRFIDWFCQHPDLTEAVRAWRQSPAGSHA